MSNTPIAASAEAACQRLAAPLATIRDHGVIDPSTPRAAPTTATVPAKRAPARPRMSRLTLFPQTAVKVPVGPNGLPRVEAEVDAFSETNFFTNVAGDVRDRGGLFVATYAVLAVHTPCEVALKFPGDYLAELRGVVKWRDDANAESTIEPGIGIEITDASDEVWSLILRFVENREPIVRDV